MCSSVGKHFNIKVEYQRQWRFVNFTPLEIVISIHPYHRKYR